MPNPSSKGRLYKREKLCSRQAIETLFARDGNVAGLCSSLAYPLRAVWRDTSADEGSAPVSQFMISVPKKRLRHAVDRVRIRRLVREAWRLNRGHLPAEARVQIAFVYVAPQLTSYARICHSVIKLMDAAAASIAPSLSTPTSSDSDTSQD